MSEKETKRVKLTPEMANNLFNNEKKRMENLINEKRRIESNLFNTDRSIFALKELSSNKNDDLFVNLGSGVYVNATLKNNKSAKFMVGSDVFIDKPVDEIVALLEERKLGLQKDLTQISKIEHETNLNLNNLYTFLMKSSNKSN